MHPQAHTRTHSNSNRNNSRLPALSTLRLAPDFWSLIDLTFNPSHKHGPDVNCLFDSSSRSRRRVLRRAAIPDTTPKVHCSSAATSVCAVGQGQRGKKPPLHRLRFDHGVRKEGQAHRRAIQRTPAFACGRGPLALDPLPTISVLPDLIPGPGLDREKCIVRYVLVLCHPRNLPG